MADSANPTAATSLQDLLDADDDATVGVLLPKSNKIVQVRGLTRWEAVHISDTKGTADREIKMISFAMVEPALTFQDAKNWYGKASSADLQELTMAIARESGMEDGADKDTYQRFPDED